MKPPKLDRAAFGGAYESTMRALAKVVTDRRWAAPLSAMALGFGLFLGVAIGPGVSGSAAGPAGQVVAVQIPSSKAGPEPAAEAEPLEEFEEEEDEGRYEEEESSEAEPFEAVLIPEESAPEAEPEPEPAAVPPPAEPEAGEGSEAVAVKGTVVRVNPAARSYTLAAPSGELVSVHAPKLPLAGEKLAVEATPLPNNTFAEEKRQRGGAATAASFSGVVTYVDPDPLAPAYTVSGRGSSLLVHVDAAELESLPALGAYAKVGVAIEPAPAPAPEATPPADPTLPPPPCAAELTLDAPPAPATRLVQTRLEVEAAPPATYVDLAGVLVAVCPASGQVLLSADDMRESGADLTLTVPLEIKTAKLEIGDSLLATAELGAAGALNLAGLASDEGRKGAEDGEAAQGDLAR